MLLLKMVQLAGLFVLIGSLHITTAATLRDWEGSSFEEEAENGFGEGKIEVPDSEPTVVVDVAMPELKQNEVKSSRRDLAMVATQGNVRGSIKDETATTGDNAKKKLPTSIKKAEVHQSPYLHEINHSLISHLSPIGEYHREVE